MNIQETAARIERLLARHALDGWEILLGASRNLSIEVKEQQVDSFKCSEPVGVSVRVLKDRRMGFSYSTSLSDADLARMIDNAVMGAAAQTPDDAHCLPDPGPYPVIEGLFDEALETAGEEQKVALAMELERLTLSADSRVKKVRKCSYGEMDYLVHIRNSRGVDSGYRGSSVSCSVSVLAEGDGDSQMGWDFGFSPYLSGLKIDGVARTAAGNALRLLGARKIPTMRCPVVLDPFVATEILEVLAPAFLAENVHKGKSLLAGKVGEPLFSPLLRIRDDGTLPGGMSSSPFDAEGVAHRNTILAEGGTLQGYLYDSFHARRDGVSSTGNCVRSGVKGVPHLGITNLFIENGAVPPADLVRGIDRGMLITDVMGMHTANPVSGDFSVGAAGLLVENGAITHPVKGVAIAGNILDLFRSVDAVGNDLRLFGASGAPSLRITALDVSGE